MAISPEYKAYLTYDPRWKSKRLKVLQRARHKCELCKRRQATQVHHKTYENIFNEPLSDLIAVCASCHAEIHGIKEKPKKRRRLFGRILAKVIG